LQPGAVCSDAKGFSPPLGSPGSAGTSGCTWQFYLGSGGWYAPGQANGPQGSFSGHDGSLAWGPNIGWFLAIGATLALASGSFATWRARHSQEGPSRSIGDAAPGSKPS
jgi:hypothetical protein